MHLTCRNSVTKSIISPMTIFPLCARDWNSSIPGGGAKSAAYRKFLSASKYNPPQKGNMKKKNFTLLEFLIVIIIIYILVSILLPVL